MSYNKLEKLFGSEFAKKFVSAKQLAESRKLKELKKDAIEALRNHDGTFRATVNGYDVILVEIPRRVKATKTSVGNYRCGLLWYGRPENPWITAFIIDPNDAFEVETRAGDTVILIGRMKEEDGDIKFRCHAVITLDEVDFDASEGDQP